MMSRLEILFGSVAQSMTSMTEKGVAFESCAGKYCGR
jgi:hypothetical protein